MGVCLRGGRGPAEPLEIALDLLLIAVGRLASVAIDIALVALAGDERDPGFSVRTGGELVEEPGDGLGAVDDDAVAWPSGNPVRMSSMMRSGVSWRGLSEVTMIASE
jgi:hypothetical protein